MHRQSGFPLSCFVDGGIVTVLKKDWPSIHDRAKAPGILKVLIKRYILKKEVRMPQLQCSSDVSGQLSKYAANVVCIFWTDRLWKLDQERPEVLCDGFHNLQKAKDVVSCRPFMCDHSGQFEAGPKIGARKLRPPARDGLC